MIAHAMPKRRLEFAAGRACARRAMIQLGVAPSAIPRGEAHEPVWPDGVVGSITHCVNYRAAAVACTSRLRAIGIDAEQHAPLPRGVLRLVSSPDEVAAVGRLRGSHGDIAWDRVFFSAKEAVYKTQFLLHRTRIGFKDIRVIIQPTAGTFVALSDCGDLEGRWRACDGLILTAVAVVV